MQSLVFASKLFAVGLVFFLSACGGGDNNNQSSVASSVSGLLSHLFFNVLSLMPDEAIFATQVPPADPLRYTNDLGSASK